MAFLWLVSGWRACAYQSNAQSDMLPAVSFNAKMASRGREGGLSRYSFAFVPPISESNLCWCSLEILQHHHPGTTGFCLFPDDMCWCAAKRDVVRGARALWRFCSFFFACTHAPYSCPHWNSTQNRLRSMDLGGVARGISLQSCSSCEKNMFRPLFCVRCCEIHPSLFDGNRLDQDALPTSKWNLKNLVALLTLSFVLLRKQTR